MQKTFKTKKSIESKYNAPFVTIDTNNLEYNFFSVFFNKQCTSFKTEDIDKKIIENMFLIVCDKTIVKNIIEHIKKEIINYDTKRLSTGSSGQNIK